MIMLMIMPFTWQVFADEPLPDDQETPAVQSEDVQPEPPKEEAVNTGHEAAEAPQAAVSAEPAAAETPAAPEADESLAAEEAPVTETADKPEPEYTEPEAGNDEHVTEAAPAAMKAASAPKAAGSTGEAKIIKVDGTSIDGSEDCSGSGWTYEKESGRIVLRDYTGSADITSDGTGVDIVSTGYNRIGTLSCDGDINVTGAGVLLIDKVELAEGCNFNLLPLQEYYGKDGGSVSVFILQEDGSYMLANGAVKGIIDEKVELPEDIRLVLPADSLLELQALKVKAEIDDDGNKTIIRDLPDEELSIYDDACEVYCGYLCVGDLTLNKGSRIRNNNLETAVVASIAVGGNLVNEGVISGGNVTVVQNKTGSGGLYSGSGTIENSCITLRTGQTMSINIKDSTLNLEYGEYTIEQLNLAGSSELYYRDDSEIKNIKGTSGSTLDIYSFDLTNNLKLNETIDGVDVLIKSGITKLMNGLTLDGGTVNNNYSDKTYGDIKYGGMVFDCRDSVSGSNEEDEEDEYIASDGTEGPVFLRPLDALPVTDTKSIPVVSFNLLKDINFSWNLELTENYRKGQDYAPLDVYNTEDHNKKITYNDLITKYCPDDLKALEEGKKTVIFEVLRCKKNELSVTILGKDYKQETDPDGVFLIRMADLETWENQIGGTTTTSTRASQTGSGNIGGNSKSIITGTGITRFSSVDPVDPEPNPVKPDPVKPDPDPVKPDPVKPDPDPAKPSKKYTAAAGNGSGDTLAILINEFDLNEGNENAEKAPYYSLSAYINGAQVSKLSAAVKVGMDYVLPEEFRDKPLYAVFANEDETSDETLTAVSAVYDEEAGELTFEAPQVGEFIIVAFEFDGEEFSPEFYDELEKTDEAKLFIKHLEENKKNAGL